MDIANLEVEIAKLLLEVSKTIQCIMRKHFECAGITLPQGMVIGTLLDHGEMKISDLSREINLSNSTISGIVDRLESQKIVTRIRGEKDRRTVYVKLMPKFREEFGNNHKKAELCFMECLKSGTTEELLQISSALQLLRKILLANGQNDSESDNLC